MHCRENFIRVVNTIKRNVVPIARVVWNCKRFINYVSLNVADYGKIFESYKNFTFKGIRNYKVLVTVILIQLLFCLIN